MSNHSATRYSNFIYPLYLPSLIIAHQTIELSNRQRTHHGKDHRLTHGKRRTQVGISVQLSTCHLRVCGGRRQSVSSLA